MRRGTSAFATGAAGVGLILLVSCTSTDTGTDGGSGQTADPPATQSASPTPDTDEGAPHTPTPNDPETDPEGDPDIDEDDLSDEESALLAQVRADGRVEVLVEHALEATPGPTAEYRRAIADAQQDLLDDLAAFDIEEGRRFDHRPLFSVTVDEAALAYLFEAPQVVRLSAVTDDEPG